MAKIGNFGRGEPELQIWLDRYSGHAEWKLYAGLSHNKYFQLKKIKEGLRESLPGVRVINDKAYKKDKNSNYLKLKKPLAPSEFNAPVLEKYDQYGLNFFGFYSHLQDKVQHKFCERAVDFFANVSDSLLRSKVADENSQDFPQNENRKLVKSHIARERSGRLAEDCKKRDKYRCRVCGLLFEEVYGDLGHKYAEAHHCVPLARLKEEIQNRTKDLITVCANCHRMLHRMSGEAGDWKKLKTVLTR